MGKNILVQRRGRGTAVFRAPTYRRKAPATYPPVIAGELTGVLKGGVSEIVHDPGRGTPLAQLVFENGDRFYVPATEGLGLEQTVARGGAASAEIGNILPVGKIPEGTLVCNLELKAGDGGTIARASGTYALIVAHTPRGTEVRLPSGRSLYLKDECRATIGVISAAGRTEKPFLKAGTKSLLMKARGRHWPIVKGQKMVSASHPYGGGRHKHAGKPTTVGRNTPPGRKVGMIAARQTGRAAKRMRQVAQVL
jgi:large subunit ribosomal protein L2